MKRKQTKQPQSHRAETVIGVAWYRPEQWQRLLEVAVDRESLHETYEEWAADATARFEDFRRMGIRVQKVEVDLEELIHWCRVEQRKMDGEARSIFVAEKTTQLNESKGAKKGGYV